MPTLLLLLTLTLLPTAAHAVPAWELIDLAWERFLYHAGHDPLPEPIEEEGNYYWTGTAWALGSGPLPNIYLQFWGPDRDDHILVAGFPPQFLTEPDDLRWTITLVGSVETLLPTPEPGTWLLLGSGLGGLAISARWGPWARRRAGGAPARR